MAGEGNRRCTAVGAFTLLETILALTILAMVAGASVLSFAAWGRGTALKHGALRVEGALRRAAADAARRGRRLRLAFVEGSHAGVPTWRMQVLWEGDPLAEPDTWTAYAAALWPGDLPNELVTVEQCLLVGPDAARPAEASGVATGGEDAPLQAVTFYPDGSSDTAVLVLASREEPEAARRAVIELHGLTGTIRLREATAEQLDAIRRDDGTFDWAELDDE